MHNANDVYRLLALGCDNRSTGSTEMNKESSRSHAIFTITVCKKCTDEVTYRGKLNFVDLAGSERLNKTKATGSRAQEGISINKSLSTLSKVIEALVTHQLHIPYRESSLTRLLKDSLGGNARTVMIACVSPADSNCSETLSTLRWAGQARKIQNKPVVNMDPATAEILKLKQRVAELEEMLGTSERGSSLDGSSVHQKQQVLLLENEVTRLRGTLLKTQGELDAAKRDLAFLMTQKKQDGFDALLKEKNEEIARLKDRLALPVVSVCVAEVQGLLATSADGSGMEGSMEEGMEEDAEGVLDGTTAETEEESLLNADEEDKARLESLTAQESRITTLLQSKQQMQSLKEKYESKILQIASQLELLTVGASGAGEV